MTYPIKTPKKLIEVALPLDDINIACAREKSIRHGSSQYLAFVVGETAISSGTISDLCADG